MSYIDYTDCAAAEWESVSEGVEKTVLRDRVGENRMLLRIAPGKGYPKHAHPIPYKIFIIEGIYVNPGVEGGREFGTGFYLYYPEGAEHNATSPTGCTY